MQLITMLDLQSDFLSPKKGDVKKEDEKENERKNTFSHKIQSPPKIVLTLTTYF